MVEREQHAGAPQKGRDIEGILAEGLQVAMDGLGQSPHPEVDFDPRPRQPARHFLADEEVAHTGQPLEHLEAAVDVSWSVIVTKSIPRALAVR